MNIGTTIAIACSVACLALLMNGCSGNSSSGGMPSVHARSDPHSNDVFQQINQYRAAMGKAPLVRHAGLDKLAAQHSAHLLQRRGSFSLHGKNVSHDGFEARVLAARRIYGMDTVSENVAAGVIAGDSPGSQLLSMWKRSKDHHNNMLEDWTYTGIGIAKDSDNTVFCTQIFASPAFGNQQLRDRINNNF